MGGMGVEGPGCGLPSLVDVTPFVNMVACILLLLQPAKSFGGFLTYLAWC